MSTLGPWRCWAFILPACVATLIAATPAWSQPGRTQEHRGSCLTVELPGQLKMPDGSSRRAGKMQICLERWITPTTALHELSLDGLPWGLVMSRAGRDDTIREQHASVVFKRSSPRHAVLVGYARPDHRGMITHVFHRVGDQTDPRFEEPARLLQACRLDDNYIVVAAGPRR